MKYKLLLLITVFLVSCFAEQKSPLIIGIAPHSSTRVILQSHQDLRIFFKKYFNRPVEILTAKNFSEFSKRSNEGSYYDLVLTSPNLAVLAERMGGYTPLMTYTKGLSTIVLSKDENILEKRDTILHVVGLDPVSFPTLDAQNWLVNHGFEEGKNVEYTYTSATDSAISILMNNHADLIIMSLPNYLKLITKKNKDLVHVIYQSDPKPSRIYLAKSGKGLNLEEWERALEAFSTSAEGKHHLEITKLEGFKKVSPGDLDYIESIVEKTKKRLYNK